MSPYKVIPAWGDWSLGKSYWRKKMLGFTGKGRAYCAAAVAATLLAGAAREAAAVPAYALTDENDLILIDTAAPEDILAGGPITGLNTALGTQDLIGIDFRPATGQLYGIGNLGGIFVINPQTRVAVQTGTLLPDPTDITDGNAPFTGLSGSRYGIDFNPLPDRLRIVSNTEQNLRVNVDTGLTITDGDLQYGANQPGATGDNPNVTSAAYTNSFAPSPRTPPPGTTLYTIDVRSSEDRLLIQNPPNAGTLTLVGSLGVDAASVSGFDIVADGSGNNTGLAALQLIDQGVSRLYSINLATGAATPLGIIGGGDIIDGLAVVPEPAGLALLGLGAAGFLARRRRA